MSNNDNANDNEGKHKKPPYWVVDQEIARLIAKYNNPDGKRLYGRALNYLPISKIYELEKRADTEGRNPGRLLTRFLSDELTRTGNNSGKYKPNLDDFRKNYGG